jgi:glucuronate isomerase
MAVHQPAVFNEWVGRLAQASQRDISSFSAFVEAIQSRHRFFHDHGCRLSDHGLEHCFSDFCPEKRAAAIFDKARRNEPVSPSERAQFASHMMLLFGHWDAERGWTKQLHLGALRNNNTRLMMQIGPDTGFDSINDCPQAASLSAYLDRLDRENALPKTIIYNLNPADNHLIGTMIGNFQDSSIPGKIQFGSAWWFLDQKEGMECQINTLSHLGLLSRFVGMLTDSRSFMSFPRHEYFRRVLCNLVGRDVENGEIPDDDSLVGPLIRNICFGNAQRYLSLGDS